MTKTQTKNIHWNMWILGIGARVVPVGLLLATLIVNDSLHEIFLVSFLHALGVNIFGSLTLWGIITTFHPAIDRVEFSADYGFYGEWD